MIQVLQTPNILIIGAGAIGSFYGYHLAQAGAQVSLVCRSNYNLVKIKGITIHSIWGNDHFTPHHVYASKQPINDIFDYIFVTTKVLPDVNTVTLIKPYLTKHTAIVLLQNGINIEAPIQAAFPYHEIISAIAFIGVVQTTPGVIEHQGLGRITLGSYPAGITQRVKALYTLFTQSPMPTQLSDNIIHDRWVKLMWNAGYNSISVLGGKKDTHAILNNQNTRHLNYNIMQEVRSIAAAEGYLIDEAIIKQQETMTLTKMPAYKTSMLIDYENNKPTEHDAILGNAISIAHKHELAVPYMEACYALLSLINDKTTYA